MARQSPTAAQNLNLTARSQTDSSGITPFHTYYLVLILNTQQFLSLGVESRQIFHGTHLIGGCASSVRVHWVSLLGRPIVPFTTRTYGAIRSVHRSTLMALITEIQHNALSLLSRYSYDSGIHRGV